uniref:Cilia- and flagella-associated protein 53 n=1 Tax=Scleropages formosus TaxID=113540 RepID=A0A8C9S6G3_SCLFO
DLFIRTRRQQEAARDKVLDYTQSQKRCSVMTQWEKSTNHRFVLRTVKRRIQETMNRYNMSIEERKERLREMLEVEEKELLMEMEAKKETVMDKEAKMREQAKIVRKRREGERARVVADKLDQLFREQSEELRIAKMQERRDMVCAERAVQLRNREEAKQQQLEDERLFAQLWEADRKAKEKREEREVQQQQRANRKQQDFLRVQMEEAEEKRVQTWQLKEEEAQLQRQQREMLRLEEEREHRGKLLGQERTRRQLNHGLRLKMKRLAKEHQEELALDLSILEELQQKHRDESHDQEQRKLELQQEQRKYRQYLAERLEEQKRQEAEIELLIEEELERTWAKRAEQSRLEREARDRLMKEVLDIRRLQIQDKLDQNIQKQAELAQEEEELNKIIQQHKELEEEEKNRYASTAQYRADLLSQMQYQQRIRDMEQSELEHEFQQGLVFQEKYNSRLQEALTQPSSHPGRDHPFRTTMGRFTSSGQRSSQD